MADKPNEERYQITRPDGEKFATAWKPKHEKAESKAPHHAHPVAPLPPPAAPVPPPPPQLTEQELWERRQKVMASMAETHAPDPVPVQPVEPVERSLWQRFCDLFKQ